MGSLMRNGIGYSNTDTGVLMRNGINYTGGVVTLVPTALVPTMSSNTQGGYTARASSEWDSSYQAYMCFDNTDATEWAPLNGQPSNWVEIEMPEAKIASRIIVKTRSGSFYARSVTLQGSNDGVTYTTLGTISGIGKGASVTFTNIPRTAYSIFRFVIDDYGLSEIYIEGYAQV